MSTALYRRYRPESFAEVIGQEHVTGPLMQALRTGRVTHAYLFSGPRGCGKTTSARILARTLNCAQNTPENPIDVPCGECPSCIDLARGGSGSLDVVEIDAASHNGVDDARELRERAAFAPARDRYKIFILDEAHMVTPQGFNALLKIVEEPPEHVKFVFATTEPDKVIGTIRSRTHHYPFRLVAPDTLGPYLEQLCQSESVALAPGVVPLVTRAGGGSVRDSLSVLDQLLAGAQNGSVEYERAVALLGFTPATLLDDVMAALAAVDGASVFRVIEHVIESGHEPRRFVEDVLERLRDLIVIAVSGDNADAALRSVPPDQLERMKEQAANLGLVRASRSADLANAALTEMTGATSPRLHLELLFARLLIVPDAAASAAGAFSPRDNARAAGGGARMSSPTVPSGPVAPARATAAAPAAPPGSAQSQPAESPVSAPRPTVWSAPVTDASESTPTSTVAPDSTSGSETSHHTPAVDAPAEDARATVAAPEPAPGSTPPAVESQSAPSHAPAPHEAPALNAVPEASAVPAANQMPADWAPAPAAAPIVAPSAGPATGPVPVTAGTAPATTGPVPAQGGSGTTAGLTTEELRRRWPEVLQALRSSRATWSLISANAQIADLSAGVLYLSFPSPGLARTFSSPRHVGAVESALKLTLGINVQVMAADPDWSTNPSRRTAAPPAGPSVQSAERTIATTLSTGSPPVTSSTASQPATPQAVQPTGATQPAPPGQPPVNPHPAADAPALQRQAGPGQQGGWDAETSAANAADEAWLAGLPASEPPPDMDYSDAPDPGSTRPFDPTGGTPAQGVGTTPNRAATRSAASPDVASPNAAPPSTAPSDAAVASAAAPNSVPSSTAPSSSMGSDALAPLSEAQALGSGAVSDRPPSPGDGAVLDRPPSPGANAGAQPQGPQTWDSQSWDPREWSSRAQPVPERGSTPGRDITPGRDTAPRDGAPRNGASRDGGHANVGRVGVGHANGGRATVGHGDLVDTEGDPMDEADGPSLDDPDLSSTGLAGPALVVRILEGDVIEEVIDQG